MIRDVQDWQRVTGHQRLTPSPGATYRLTFKPEVADPEATTELEPFNVPSCAMLWVLNSEWSTGNRVPKWYDE